MVSRWGIGYVREPHFVRADICIRLDRRALSCGRAGHTLGAVCCPSRAGSPGPNRENSVTTCSGDAQSRTICTFATARPAFAPGDDQGNTCIQHQGRLKPSSEPFRQFSQALHDKHGRLGGTAPIACRQCLSRSFPIFQRIEPCKPIGLLDFVCPVRDAGHRQSRRSRSASRATHCAE
jgi:hypothetical protein